MNVELLPLLEALELKESRVLKDRMKIMENRIKQLEFRFNKCLQSLEQTAKDA